jgi:hypothetical protein
VIVLAIAVPSLALLFRVPRLSRFGVAIASIAIGHTAWHWTIDRTAVLSSLEWPAFNEATVASLARVLIALMLVGAAIHVLARRRQPSVAESAREIEPPAWWRRATKSRTRNRSVQSVATRSTD